ncbi:MAG: hypothetical protein IPJ30_08800 [Acidobacteria bacterium]|nr:hypothetical protein [Acidobacteriota bacterium]
MSAAHRTRRRGYNQRSNPVRIPGLTGMTLGEALRDADVLDLPGSARR